MVQEKWQSSVKVFHWKFPGGVSNPGMIKALYGIDVCHLTQNIM